MRSLGKSLFAASFACALAAVSGAREASAEAPPREFKSLVTPESLALATPRANVASLAPLSILPVHPAIVIRGYYSAAKPLRTTGFVVFGLGLSALAASGIAGIVAAASSSRLDSDCPNKVCVEGSLGADTYRETRDAAIATDWLLGIGAPVTASGIVMLLYSAVVDRYALNTLPRPTFQASPGGGSLAFSF